MAEGQSPHVLVVEDDPATANLLTTVLRDVDPSISTDVVPDGSDCLAVLRGEHDGVDDADLVLLDLNLETVDGLAVLEHRTGEASLRHTPIVVVSRDDDPGTIARCYRHGANAVFSKPDDLDGFQALVETIVDHWLGHAELPDESVPRP